MRRAASLLSSLRRPVQRALLSPRVTVPAAFRSFSSGLPSHTPLTMPALSPTMAAGTIAEWCKKEGEQIKAGDVIAKIETDKATVDLEATDDGVLGKILVQSGEVAVGKLIAVMAESTEAAVAFKAFSVSDFLPSTGSAKAVAPTPSPPPATPTAPSSAASATAPAAVTASSSTSSGGRLAASPYAKKLALEAGVALGEIAGTGPGGRIIAADVSDWLKSGASRPVAASASASASAVASAAAGAPAVAAASGPSADVAVSGMRRVIAARLTSSKQTVPHYYLTSEIALDALLSVRATLNATLPVEGKLSVNDFIIRAVALACKKVPEVNSSWLDSVIRTYDYVDVSVAVAVPDGLITPIVRDAHVKGLSAINSSVKSLVAKARAKTLKPDEYQGGTITVSNLGSFGVRQFAAIVNPPQAGILAVGAAERRVVPDAEAGPNAFKSATVMNVTLSADHRVVDGAVGAAWLGAFKGFMEAPNTMLL